MSGGKVRKLPVGSKVGGDLTVLGNVDDGGHAPVYIVWNHRAWCPMACKVFRSAKRAADEAKILSALAHPNIVRLLGTGRRPAYILMEFLEGATLKSMVKANPRSGLNVSDAARIAIHLGAALAHMHKCGILHLDIKPSNVIVARGRPVLFDLGTARARADWSVPCVEGTDPYMAPEQCLRHEPVTPATDVFGLGATLYQLLTAKLPFPHGTKRNPFPQITTDATPMRRHRPGIPVALDDLVLRCLARDPARRPASPGAILPFLHDFIRSGPRMWPEGLQPEDSEAQAPRIARAKPAATRRRPPPVAARRSAKIESDAAIGSSYAQARPGVPPNPA